MRHKYVQNCRIQNRVLLIVTTPARLLRESVATISFGLKGKEGGDRREVLLVFPFPLGGGEGYGRYVFFKALAVCVW